MLVVTTPSLQGRTITEYLGGRSAAYERELERARGIALSEMAEQAQDLGGAPWWGRPRLRDDRPGIDAHGQRQWHGRAPGLTGGVSWRPAYPGRR